ncbi:STAS domain-containing protein [Antribacter gilvus]|uniref:STAS domain-containing protein n=1 Tax=Antribacter gilvus TaxID=2304675 RepID=UPI000F771C95|nr:STAS domain-containing protein [Antribacter gilvus]
MDPLPSSTTSEPRSGSGIACRHTFEGSVITLWGDVDALLREPASEAMASLAARPAPAPVIVDARDVTFIDSSGVAFILQVFVLGEETGSPVLLREPSAAVMEVLEMVGISERLPVVGSAKVPA